MFTEVTRWRAGTARKRRRHRGSVFMDWKSDRPAEVTRPVQLREMADEQMTGATMKMI